MGGFRGSRRLMARILEHRKAKQANRAISSQHLSPEEIELRKRLNAEADTLFNRYAEPRLVKQAPKREA